MEVTSVKIKKINKENSKLKGIASILIDNCFLIHDIKIIEGTKGLFLVMPAQKEADDKHDIVHPITKYCRMQLENAVINEYNNLDF